MQLSDAVGGIQRVGAGQLVNGDDGRGLAVEPAAQVVNLRAEFDARDVLQPHHASRRDWRG